MWNKLVYERGGLALHAGCKVIPADTGEKVGLIVGLSGTGKTTTTFTKQNNSSPVQDDFCALMPGGKVYATENGCFAKTFGLNPKTSRRSTARSRSRTRISRTFRRTTTEVDFFDGVHAERPRGDPHGRIDAAADREMTTQTSC